MRPYEHWTFFVSTPWFEFFVTRWLDNSDTGYARDITSKWVSLRDKLALSDNDTLTVQRAIYGTAPVQRLLLYPWRATRNSASSCLPIFRTGCHNEFSQAGRIQAFCGNDKLAAEACLLSD